VALTPSFRTTTVSAWASWEKRYGAFAIRILSLTPVEPLFDRKGQTVAWIQDDRILNRAGEHIAFLSNESVVDYAGRHLGVFRGGFVRDHAGHAVAYVRGATGGPLTPLPAVPPLPPSRPLPRIKPMPPFSPLPGMPSVLWSRLSWDQFLAA